MPRKNLPKAVRLRNKRWQQTLEAEVIALQRALRFEWWLMLRNRADTCEHVE